MSLIDIESAKKHQQSSTIGTPTSATPTQAAFEFPLRSTLSFPHILDQHTKKMEKENSNAGGPQIDEIMYQISNAVQFNAGCSSSSTDLDKLIEFYNAHSDEETLAQWMTIYEEQKLANSIAANSSAGRGSSNNHHKHESNLSHFKNRDISDSVDDLLHSSPKRMTKHMDSLSKDAPFNRSMDLPMINAQAKDGFFALEKCQSVDFHTTKFDLPTTRLLRSKEMPNIADVDDSLEY